MATDDVLVADIGGTNARFAMAREEGGRICVDQPHTFRAEDFETIRDAADAYLEAVSAKPKSACFAVAGPVTDEAIAFTNSPWVLKPTEIKPLLELQRLVVVNDFEAQAAGVSSLGEGDLLKVKDGAPDARAPRLVIGPGTGLGQALIVPRPAGETIVPTEGGHVSFAPRTDVEIEIMKFVAREHPRVSVERLLSGRGLVNIHRALCSVAGVQRVSLRADEITKAAETEEFPIAVEAVDVFCALLGAVAGDAVLATGARGGVVLGGGILPKIRETFLASRFRERFADKGRMRVYLEATPVDLIVTEGAALVGAAAILKKRGHDAH
ncbi:MAG: glucokinase [Parvularculaceae bacterium]